jgi:hypothetical protein
LLKNRQRQGDENLLDNYFALKKYFHLDNAAGEKNFAVLE